MYESEGDLDFESSETSSENQEIFDEDESENEYVKTTNQRKVLKKKVKKKLDNSNEQEFQASFESLLTLEQRQIKESKDRFHQNLKELMEREEEEKRIKQEEREQPTLQKAENQSYKKIQGNEKRERINSEERELEILALIQEERYERDLAKHAEKEQESLGASGYSIPVNHEVESLEASGYSIPVNHETPFWNSYYHNEIRKRERESADRFDRYLREFMEKEEEERRLRREKCEQRVLEMDDSHSFKEFEANGNKRRISSKKRLLKKLALIKEEYNEDDLVKNAEVEQENLGASGYSIPESNKIKTGRKPTSSKIKQYLNPECCLTEQLIEPEYNQPTAQDMVLMDAKKFSKQLNLGIKELLAEEEKMRERRYLEAQKKKDEKLDFEKYNKKKFEPMDAEEFTEQLDLGVRELMAEEEKIRQRRCIRAQKEMTELFATAKYNKKEFESSFLYMSARDETRRKERLSADSFDRSLREFMNKEEEENLLNEGKREEQSLETDDSHSYEKTESYERDLGHNVEKEEENMKLMDAKEFSEQLDLGIRELMAEEEKIRQRRYIRAQKKMKELLATTKYNKKEFESSFLYMSARDETRRKERLSADSFDRSLREFMNKEEEENLINEGKIEEQSLETDDSHSYEKTESNEKRESINSRERDLEILALIEEKSYERDLGKNVGKEEENKKPMDAKEFSEQLDLGIRELMVEEEKIRHRRYIRAQKKMKELLATAKYNKNEFESSFLYMSARDETRRKERLSADSFDRSLREFMNKEEEETRLNEGKRVEQSLETDDSHSYEKIENQTFSCQAEKQGEPNNSEDRQLEILDHIEQEIQKSYEMHLAKNTKKELENLNASEYSITENIQIFTRNDEIHDEKISSEDGQLEISPLNEMEERDDKEEFE
ncbi:trichohyalin-like isoform X2 [Teleopsis dalmanni]|uniref:trichohyalin-like isoform X2 n=1 Tax=Teleopsis dalmanni TaxID=139649 RepID=UPI0018CD8FF7|nr:trichohyalin-like isoform X2 [Teleopsis dalmanni]